MLVNFFIGFSVGANVATSRYYGSRDYDGVQKTVHTAMLLSVICGSVLAVVGILAARPLLVAMSTPADVLDMAVLYLRIYFGGMPITMIYNFGAALLRSVGDTRRPLYCLTASGLVNVVLNLIFVILFDMSVAGVALATVISQGIAAFMVVCILLREQGPLHLDMRLLRLSPEPLRLIITVGLPTGVQSIVFNVANVVVQSTINSFGSAAMAGAAAAHSIEGFVYCIMDSFAQTCVTFTSQNLGEAGPCGPCGPAVQSVRLWLWLGAGRIGGLPQLDFPEHLFFGPCGDCRRKRAHDGRVRHLLPVRPDGC